MINYLKQLIRSGSGESSKRFIAIYSLFLFTIVIILYCFNFKIPVEIIYALVSLILGSSSMTLFTKNNIGNKTSEYNVDTPTYTSVNYDNQGNYSPNFDTQKENLTESKL